jgi:hypothetical protein
MAVFSPVFTGTTGARADSGSGLGPNGLTAVFSLYLQRDWPRTAPCREVDDEQFGVEFGSHSYRQRRAAGFGPSKRFSGPDNIAPPQPATSRARTGLYRHSLLCLFSSQNSLFDRLGNYPLKPADSLAS